MVQKNRTSHNDSLQVHHVISDLFRTPANMTIHVNMYEYLCNHVTKLHGVDGVHPGVDALHGFLPPDRAATCNLLHAACCRHAAGCMQPACRLMTRRRLQAAARCMQAARSLHNAVV